MYAFNGNGAALKSSLALWDTLKLTRKNHIVHDCPVVLQDKVVS